MEVGAGGLVLIGATGLDVGVGAAVVASIDTDITGNA